MRQLIASLCFCVLTSLQSADNTPWLLPQYEPEATFGLEQPLCRTSHWGKCPFILVKACGAFSEKSEMGFTAYSRPLSCSLSYERELTNDLDRHPFASSLFVQGGNALPWNGGLVHTDPFALFGGGRMGFHYYLKGDSYGQLFLSLGLLGRKERETQKVTQVGMNYSFHRQHKIQMEAWTLFGAKKSSDVFNALMLTYTYLRENQSQLLVGCSLRRTQGGGWAPFLTLSYVLPLSLDAL